MEKWREVLEEDAPETQSPTSHHVLEVISVKKYPQILFSAIKQRFLNGPT